MKEKIEEISLSMERGHRRVLRVLGVLLAIGLFVLLWKWRGPAALEPLIDGGMRRWTRAVLESIVITLAAQWVLCLLPWPLLALGVAGWIRYVSGTDESGNAIDVRDPLSDKIRTIVNASSDIDRVPALLGLSEVFGHDLAHNRVFVEAVSQAYQRITRHGARQAVIETLNI